MTRRQIRSLISYSISLAGIALILFCTENTAQAVIGLGFVACGFHARGVDLGGRG